MRNAVFLVWESCHKKLRRRKNKLRRNSKTKTNYLSPVFVLKPELLRGVGRIMERKDTKKAETLPKT